MPALARTTRRSSPATAPTATPARGGARAPASARRRAGSATRAGAAGAASSAPAVVGPAIKLSASAASKDPRFQQTLDKLQKSAAKTKQHPPASKKAAEAQAAALAPANEKLAGAKSNQVDAMKEAESKKPESSSFLDLLRAEIRKVMPKKVEDTEDYMKGGDKQQLKGAMTGNLSQQKQEATSGIQSASEQAPDPSAVPGKEVTPLPSEGAPAPPPPVNAAEGMPAPKPDAEVTLKQGKQDADKTMADADITNQQMQKANDPRFSAVVANKSKADSYADSAPGKFRGDEQKAIADAAAKAVADEKQGLGVLQNEKGKSGAQVQARQLTAKQKDEARRKEVADTIEKIFQETKQAVENKLNSLDTDVESMFDRGSERAIQNMKDYVEKRFDDRYSGISGKALWLKDKLLPLPDAVQAWFDQAHQAFLQELDSLVVSIANLVESRLRDAKAEIAKGQQRIKTYVESLPKDLQAVGKAAEQEVAGRFDDLRRGVDERKEALAQKLAQRYKDAHDKGAAALKEMKDAHKSLLQKLRDAIAEVIEILRKFKERVVAMLKKGEATIKLIIADPIGFLKNLLNAVKKGISQFVDNIWTHLKAGFMAWMFGTLGEAGIQVPKDFSLGSILMLVLQVLGITYARIRAKAAKLIGERNVAILEKLFELLKALWDGGPAALWEKLKEFLGDLKQTIIDGIQEWLIATIIKAAVTKLISMFNPVGAIIQAILTIYNVVMFFIERINQILAFVEAVINSVHKIATGAIGDAANWIEQALARTIPLIIGFLARLLGISGITQKIKSIIEKIQAKVDLAIDKVIGKIVAGIGKLFGGAKGKEGATADDGLHATLGKAAAAELAKKPSAALPYDELRKVKEKQAAEVAAQYSKQLKSPVKMKITLKAAEEDRKDNDIDFHIHIGPNDFDLDSAVEGAAGGHPPKAGLYGTLRGELKPDQESHHVPPKGVLNWLVTQATNTKQQLGKTKSGKETLKKNVWIGQLASINSSAYDPGNQLASINISKFTHIKKTGDPAKDVWRAHFGAETSREVLRRLKSEGLTLIWRTQFNKLSQADKDLYLAELGEAGATAPAVGGAEPLKPGLSTQFFHTELNNTLQLKMTLGDGSAESLRKNLGSVAKGAYVQAREAVTVALEKSDRDGTKEERQTELVKMKGLSQQTWTKYPGVKDLGMF